MKPCCKECWDPVDKKGADLCDWCQMTPAQREAKLRRSCWLLAIAGGLILAALWYVEIQA